jgi:MOSC domain-containing protein YiiM
MPDGGLARCVERLVGEEPGSLPEGEGELGEWLAAAGLRLVPVAEPAKFTMAGSFIADWGGGWTVSFGVPPGPIWAPAGGGPAGERIVAAYVLAPLELRRAEARPAPAGTGTVTAIAIAPAAGEPMQALDSATAIPGHGLEGDRYADGAGTFSGNPGSGRDLTLIEAEALGELAAAGIELDPLDARRNLVVAGIDLDALIGRRFRIGEVECSGARRCEPCAHLERLTGPGVLRGLVHRGGLRADVLTGGTIAVGDAIAAERPLSGA